GNLILGQPLLKNRQEVIAGSDVKAALGCAFRRDGFEVPVQLRHRYAARERQRKQMSHLPHLRRIFMYELEPKMANAGGEPQLEMPARFLRLGAEHGVSAAHIGHHWMRAARVVAQFDPMFLAGAAAIFIAGAFGKKAAENTMLRMKNGQML